MTARMASNPKAAQLFVLVVWALSSCGEDKNLDIPIGPDMSALLAQYERPTADLTPETIPELITTILDRLDLLDATDMLSLILDAITASDSENSTLEQELVSSSGDYATRQQALTADGVTITGRGYIQIHRVCTGWQEEPVVDETTNGYMDLTITFGDQGFDPVIWGRMVGCRTIVNDSNMLFDLAINLHIGQALAIEQLDTSAILFQLTGALTIDQSDIPLTFDFRVLPEDGIELRLALTTGSLVFMQTVTETGFRAANGTWSCDFEAQRCSQTGAASIQW